MMYLLIQSATDSLVSKLLEAAPVAAENAKYIVISLASAGILAGFIKSLRGS